MQAGSESRSASVELCRQVRRLNGGIVLNVERALNRAGMPLTFNQFLVLKRVGDEGSITPGELARIVGTAPGALTRLIDRLERAGFLQRVPHPSDRRSLLLELAPQGHEIRSRMIACASEAAAEVFACLSEDERVRLGASFGRLLAGLAHLAQEDAGT